MFSRLLSVAVLVALVNAHWIFGGTRPIVTERIDPVVNPNTIGTHVHAVVGASRFRNVYDAADLKNSKCTTIPVPQDKSNYWTPQMYFRDQQTGHLTPMPTSFNIYYLPRKGPKNEPIKAFPDGLVMVAGDTNRRSNNASNHADQAVSYVCQDFNGGHDNDPAWAERPDFFNHNCPNGLRAQVFFPACWDGKNLDSPDHKSHMAYPVQAYNSGDCPASHPVHLVSLFYEMTVSVAQFPFWGKGSWVLANGDTTGLGHHGDFQNGWDSALLQDAIDNCPNANGDVMKCPPLARVFDQASADACTLETPIVDENIGFDPAKPLTQLPGCNPMWDGTGPKPACSNPNAQAPQLVPAQETLPNGWNEVGCINEGTTGRALTGASTTSKTMTRAECANFCASKGFKLAGVEFSDECYCDNQVRNGASTNPVAWNLCTNRCAGNQYSICGGPSKLTLLSTSNSGVSAPPSVSSPVQSSTPANPPPSSVPVPPPTTTTTKTSAVSVPSAPSIPTGVTSSSTPAPSSPSTPWISVGCASDSGARALTGFSFANDKMTVGACTSACAQKGYSMAGLEYGRECYCGNTFSNGQGKALAASACNSLCTGDKASKCGGSWALSVFKANNKVDVVVPSGSSSSAPPPKPSTPVTTPSNSTNVSGLPKGWTALGCHKDSSSGRTLNVDAYTGQQMTISACIAHCAGRGHTMAGLEYSRECYCGSAFANGGGAVLADSACNMPCSGDSTRVCGGPDALSVFKNTGAVKRRTAHKARHFGKAHAGLH